MKIVTSVLLLVVAALYIQAVTNEADLAEMGGEDESPGRRGGAILTSGSFVLSTPANRAGNDEEELGEEDESGRRGGTTTSIPEGGFKVNNGYEGPANRAGYEETLFKASKSTDKKVDWITQTGTTDGELAVAGTGEILVAKVKALPSSTDAAWLYSRSSRPERKAMMGKTSDNKPFWATSFVGSLQTDTNTKGAAIRLGFVKMSICKMRSSSNGCEDSTKLEDAAATQEFEKVQQRLKNRRGNRRLLDSRSSGDLTCCTIKKMIHHCTTRSKTGAPFGECDTGGKVLAGMMV